MVTFRIIIIIKMVNFKDNNYKDGGFYENYNDGIFVRKGQDSNLCLPAKRKRC